MNTTWQIFLQNQKAIFENGYVTHFNGGIREFKDIQADTTILADLSNMGLIRFSGEDAFNFLQGQFTCDLRKVTPQTAQHGSYCTPKGRILASFIIWQGASVNEYILQLPVILLAAISKRLAMYILRAKVQIQDDSDALIRIGVAGSKACTVVEELFQIDRSSLAPLAVIHTENASILCREADRYEIITTPDKAASIWSQIASHAKPAGTVFWDWLEIRAGIPVILPDTQEQFIPQMVNLDAIGGVSFQKGCYPGQEIVARTQYLGKLKRRMYRVNILSSEPVKPGDQLICTELAEQACGMIVNAAPSPEGGYDALAVIQTANVDTDKICWKSLDGPLLRFQSLPYTIPE